MLSEVEKGAGVSPQQPRATLSRPHNDFLPTYQEHLNTELRNFPNASPQANLQPFDHIQEPKANSKASLRRRFWWSAISILLFLTVSALIGSAVFLYRSTHLKDEDGIKHAPQTTSMPMPARSATTVTIHTNITTVVVTLPPKHTVFITFPAAPVPGTTTRIITVRPSSTPTSSQSLTSSTIAGTTTRIVTVFPSSTSQALTSSTTRNIPEEEPSTIAFSTPSSSSSTTSTSSSSETAPPPPPPSTVPTTLVSVTTTTHTPSTTTTSRPPTVTGRPLGFCGVPGEFCA